MLRRYLFLISFVLITLSISCKRQVKQIHLDNVSIANGFDTAREEKKGLILISNKAGCSMCERFEIDLIKDEDFAQTLYSDFVIQRVDENATGQKWLSRILNAGGIPVFLFFNMDGKLLGIKDGALSKSGMLEITKIVKNNQYAIDPQYKFGKSNLIQAKLLPVYLENLCYAQAKWDRYTASKKINSLNKMDQDLDHTIQIQSSFYNNYLFTKYYLVKKDTIKAVQAAKKALLDDDPASLYFNTELRTELKMILNKDYSVYDDAYIGVVDIEQQLGKLKLGSSKKIRFQVKNLGNKDLKISKIMPDCGCTVARYTKTVIKPKSVGDIELEFKASRLGDFSHAIYVESNAINGHVQLYIKGTVLED
jgi:thioredoxin-related protein